VSGLRRLLRLEDKVAAEARRLENIGGPSMRWVAPAALLAAAALHGAVLLLPAVRTRAMPTAASPEPDFPLVWRRASAPVQPPAPPARPSASAPAMPPPAPNRPAVKFAARALTTEPVPEPAPELALNAISADVEAIIPNPDAPPPSLEVGPPSGPLLGPPAAGPPDAAPALIERVPPVYPVAARSLRAEGRVTLRLAVHPDGTVARALVEECTRPGFGFEAAALAAVKQWRYEPAPSQSGPRTVTVTIRFRSQEVRP
jgi:periplasmic protein TonB